MGLLVTLHIDCDTLDDMFLRSDSVDGTIGSGETPGHTYTASGEYSVILMVTDDDGGSNTDFTTATILDQLQCGEPDYPYPEGDLDFNCYVDFYDFEIFASNWLICTDPNPPCNFVP